VRKLLAQARRELALSLLQQAGRELRTAGEEVLVAKVEALLLEVMTAQVRATVEGGPNLCRESGSCEGWLT
jgi:hypothetical protein